MNNNKVFEMKLSKIYPLLVAKAERKGRTKEEVIDVINWMLGYSESDILQQLNKDIDYQTFFIEAPNINKDIHLIKGTICGVRIETIDDPMMHKIRCLDKLIDELAKGKSVAEITNRA